MKKNQRIYNTIKERILNKEYEATDNKLPTGKAFCLEFDCSLMTLNKALDQLVEEGYIYRRPKLGTFVRNTSKSNKHFLMNINLDGFSQVTHGEAKSKILSFNLQFASEVVAGALNIKINDPVYYICRVRLLDDVPYIIEYTYMPVALIPGLTIDVLNSSIYDFLENELNLQLQSSNKTICAVKASVLDCENLLIDHTDPVLEVEQVAYLNTGVPFEYSTVHFRYDKFKYTSYATRSKY